MLTRIPLKSVSDHLFASVEGIDKPIRKRGYRTVRIDQSETARTTRVFNIIQARHPQAMRDIALAYAEDAHPIAISLCESLMEDFAYGFGDVSKGAPFLVLEHDQAGSAAKIAKWLKKNTQGEVLTVEGARRTRVSFGLHDDFVLARINFS